MQQAKAEAAALDISTHADSVVLDQQVILILFAREGDADLSRSLVGEGVLERVRYQLVDDEAKRHCRCQRDVVSFGTALDGDAFACAGFHIQLVFLLVSATQVRALGVLDSVVSIVPVIAGSVTAVEWILGHLSLSSFQIISLAALIIAGVAEFLLTIWIRFVLNRRTFAVDTGTT